MNLVIVPVATDALRAVTKRIDNQVETLGITIKIGLLQKTTLLRTVRILQRVLNIKEERN